MFLAFIVFEKIELRLYKANFKFTDRDLSLDHQKVVLQQIFYQLSDIWI